MKPDETTPEGVAGAAPHDDRARDRNPNAWPQWLPRPMTLAFAGVSLLLSAMLAVFLMTAQRPVSGMGTATGTPDIGGPFELVNTKGKTVTQTDFAGKYMLVYFGYTYCPDVCPTALQVMSTALDKLGKQARKVVPIFITIDPERDTPKNMAAYVAHFHKDMVGLTGTPEQVRRAAKAYRVFYKKVQESGATDYTMNHTSWVYLMGPDGKFVTYFAFNASPDEMAKGIARILRRNGS